jgi:uncharacterized protein YjbI with pentapeptide repeats/uncharacterized membrane protein
MSTDGHREPSTRRISNRALWIIGIGLLLVALAIFVYLGYGWKWTGFQGKRLFNWLQILVLPFAVAIGIFVLNRAAKWRDDEAQREQREREQAIETERAEEASLQAYLDYISGLLTDPDRPLRKTRLGDNLSVVARAQTLTLLGRLADGERKRSVLQFLHEAGLIDRTYPIVNLEGANLEGAYLEGAYLQGAYLQGAYLHLASFEGANLHLANLKRAYLEEANLKAANLEEANLEEAYLEGANLEEAYLEGANLEGAYLGGAYLGGAYLGGAYLGGANLEGANLEGAYLGGAYLLGTLNLMQRQIDQAFGDEKTTLPEGIDRPKSWSARTDE